MTLPFSRAHVPRKDSTRTAAYNADMKGLRVADPSTPLLAAYAATI
jgi:hypothetical protein